MRKYRRGGVGGRAGHVVGEKLWGNGEATWIGNGRLDDVLYRRDEAAPEISIVYGSIDA